MSDNNEQFKVTSLVAEQAFKSMMRFADEVHADDVRLENIRKRRYAEASAQMRVEQEMRTKQVNIVDTEGNRVDVYA